jgi:hypothetical protein
MSTQSPKKRTAIKQRSYWGSNRFLSCLLRTIGGEIRCPFLADFAPRCSEASWRSRVRIEDSSPLLVFRMLREHYYTPSIRVDSRRPNFVNRSFWDCEPIRRQRMRCGPSGIRLGGKRRARSARCNAKENSKVLETNAEHRCQCMQ